MSQHTVGRGSTLAIPLNCPNRLFTWVVHRHQSSTSLRDRRRRLYGYGIHTWIFTKRGRWLVTVSLERRPEVNISDVGGGLEARAGSALSRSDQLLTADDGSLAGAPPSSRSLAQTQQIHCLPHDLTYQPINSSTRRPSAHINLKAVSRNYVMRNCPFLKAPKRPIPLPTKYLLTRDL